MLPVKSGSHLHPGGHRLPLDWNLAHHPVISIRGPKLVRMYEHPTHLASSSPPLNRVEMAELRKKMDTMPANFINEYERAGLDSAVCCESHAELEVNINNDHQAGNLNMVTESIQLGELHEFTWDEVAAYHWDNANLWDQPELASDLE